MSMPEQPGPEIEILRKLFPVQRTGAVESFREGIMALLATHPAAGSTDADALDRQQSSQADDWVGARDRVLAEAHRRLQRTPSPKTLAVLRYVEDQEDWPLPIKIDHYRRALRHEEVLRAVAGSDYRPAPFAPVQFAEPFGLLYTGVRGEGETRWSMGDTPGRSLKLYAASDHKQWVDSGAVSLIGSDVAIRGSLLPSTGDTGIFFASAGPVFEMGKSCLFAVRRIDVVGEIGQAERLAELELFCDAWRAKHAEPGLRPDRFAEFLLLFIADPITLALRRIPRSVIHDRNVDTYWSDVINSMDSARERLRDAFAPGS